MNDPQSPKSVRGPAAPGTSPSLAGAPYTDDELRTIERTLRQEFRTQLQRGEAWTASGTLDERHLGLTLVLANADRTLVATFETAAELARHTETALVDLRAMLVEFAGTLVHEWLREGRWPPPHLDWREYTWEGAELLFRGSVRNEAMEAAGDAWLRMHGESADSDES